MDAGIGTRRTSGPRPHRREGMVGRAHVVAGIEHPSGLRRHDRRLRSLSLGWRPAAGARGRDFGRRHLARIGDATKFWRRPAPVARVGPVRRADIDAGNDGHGAEPWDQRRDGIRAMRRMRRSRVRPRRPSPVPRSLRAHRLEVGRLRTPPERRAGELAHWSRRRGRRACSRRRRRAVAGRRPRSFRVSGTRVARGVTGSTMASPTASALRSPFRRWCSAISTIVPGLASCSRAIR